MVSMKSPRFDLDRSQKEKICFPLSINCDDVSQTIIVKSNGMQ